MSRSHSNNNILTHTHLHQNLSLSLFLFLFLSSKRSYFTSLSLSLFLFFMGSSTGSLEHSTNTPLSPFSFTTPFATSFSELLAGVGDEDRSKSPTSRAGGGGGGGVPKFKSTPPPSLPLSPPPFSPSSYFASPSSYFAIPPGLSPAELLDSPVLLSSHNIFPSPTTGTFPAQAFNWRPNNSHNSHQPGVFKDENRAYSDFSFHTNTKPQISNTSMLQPLPTSNSKEEFAPQNSNTKDDIAAAAAAVAPEISVPNILREPRKSDDGYNWRKYGQKQVKGSENPRSYYKCTYPNCPTKKKVERSLADGHITEIVYKGTHNHPKPQNTRRSSASSAPPKALQSSAPVNSDASDSFGGAMDSVATPENSSISFGDDEIDASAPRSNLEGEEIDEDEPDAKRWKKEGENEGASAAGNRTVREPRVVVQTKSDIDILDDGYRWRKYGQKVVKGNPNPRSYYKCTTVGCPVRKHVERASHDLGAVITTYEGKHNHDVPAARGTRPLADNNSNNNNNNSNVMAIRPSAINGPSHLFHRRLNAPANQAPFTLEMLQPPAGNYGFPNYNESSMNPSSYMNQLQQQQQQQQQQRQGESMLQKTKEEPRDDLFLDILLN